MTPDNSGLIDRWMWVHRDSGTGTTVCRRIIANEKFMSVSDDDITRHKLKPCGVCWPQGFAIKECDG